MKFFHLLILILLTSDQVVFSQSNDLSDPDKFAALAQSVNERIKCCSKLKRKIVFSRDGEFFLSFEERWNFFHLVPFSGKEELLKKIKRIINYKGGIIVYETVANEFEVTLQTEESNFVVVSRFAKRKDAVHVYRRMHRLRDLCTQIN